MWQIIQFFTVVSPIENVYFVVYVDYIAIIENDIARISLN